MVKCIISTVPMFPSTVLLPYNSLRIELASLFSSFHRIVTRPSQYAPIKSFGPA